MRLVDIDEFENNTVSEFERNNNFEYRDMVKSIIFSIVQDLDKQPTAYNIDRVIEQLEENYSCDVGNLKMISLDKAIEIVKKRGIEWANVIYQKEYQ